MKFFSADAPFLAVRGLQSSGGSWLGGMVEGKTNDGTLPVVKVPTNLAVGLATTAVAYATARVGVFANIGAGFIGSWTATKGFELGQRWRAKSAGG